jgi:hypothetical protein
VAVQDRRVAPAGLDDVDDRLELGERAADVADRGQELRAPRPRGRVVAEVGRAVQRQREPATGLWQGAHADVERADLDRGPAGSRRAVTEQTRRRPWAARCDDHDAGAQPLAGHRHRPAGRRLLQRDGGGARAQRRAAAARPVGERVGERLPSPAQVADAVRESAPELQRGDVGAEAVVVGDERRQPHQRGGRLPGGAVEGAVEPRADAGRRQGVVVAAHCFEPAAQGAGALDLATELTAAEVALAGAAPPPRRIDAERPQLAHRGAAEVQRVRPLVEHEAVAPVRGGTAPEAPPGLEQRGRHAGLGEAGGGQEAGRPAPDHDRRAPSAHAPWTRQRGRA